MDASIEKIIALEQELNNLLPMLPECKQRLDKKIRLEFNYNSNHIEGNTLTYGETKLLLIFGKTTGNHDFREYDEMRAHDTAFELVKEWAGDSERPVTEMALKNLHRILLVEPFWKEAITPDGQPTRRLIKIGDYKEHPNSVRLQTGELFEYASPAETPILMGGLIQWYKEEEQKKELHSVALAALLHYKFVRIHPFDDGNGRISRLLVNYVLLKHGLPPVIIKSADKKNYLFALNQADTGNIRAFVEYIAEQLIWSLKLYIKAAKGEELEEEDDLRKEIAVWKKGVKAESLASTKKNNGIVFDLYNSGIKEMFELFNEQTKQFDELFHKVERKDEILKKIAEEIDRGVTEDRKNADTFGRLWETVNFLEYKFNERNAFSIVSSLILQLQPYNYVIQHNQRVLVEKKYGEYVSLEEAKQVVSNCIRYVFDEIKINTPK